MTEQERDVLSKVPAVTLGFWIIKILATTLGETAGDTVTMTMKLGYLAGTAIFMTVLALLVWRQIAARRFHPFLYWATIVASTTAGTALGAQIYLWARVAYLPVYVIGIPYLRTVVWAVGFWGMLQVIEGLF